MGNLNKLNVKKYLRKTTTRTKRVIIHLYKARSIQI